MLIHNERIPQRMKIVSNSLAQIKKMCRSKDIEYECLSAAKQFNNFLST